MELLHNITEAMEKGDQAEVGRLLDNVLLEVEPDLLYELAEGLMNYGFAEEAARVYEHLIFLFPEENQLRIDKAQVLMEIGREDEALLILSEVPKTDEDYPIALLALADYYQMIGLHEAAEQRIDEAMSLLPDEPLLIFAKAELLLNSGRYLEAARLYEELKKGNAELTGVNLSERLAEVYSAGAAYEEAIPYYEEAISSNHSPELLFGLGIAAFQVGRYKTAISTLEELLSMDPDYFSAYLLLSQAHAMLEQNEKAYTVITDGIQRDSFEKEYYLVAGKLTLKLGDTQSAEDHLRQAIALDPEYMEALYTLMSLLHQYERDEEVIELFEQLKHEGSDWPALLPFVAESYSRNEQFERAYEIYTLAYTEHKEDPSFLEKYVYFLLEEGKREEAIEILKQLQNLAPDMRWIELMDSLE
ncbi:tetratricopeptide repeat protein [Chungangia koreensis]|uniref:Tetratricopeptide repeat protein n=1 Tax=Chungangia koreensis TaxID=752657 RepID=A0ABV8X6B3_9LACT